MKLELSQKQILNQLERILIEDSLDYKESSGTYNRADPTHYENYEGALWVEHGLKEDEEGFPEAELISVKLEDCTWGTEVTFTTSIGEVGAYLDHEDDKWMRVHDEFKKVFMKVLLEGSSSDPHEEHFDMPIYV